MASNSKRSRDDKTKFTEAEKNWNLEKLYEDLKAAKQRCGAANRKVLTEKEKCNLRGLLCGYSPKEIANEREVGFATVNDALSKTLYRYIQELLDYKKKIRHWGDVPDFLEKAGYKIQLSKPSQSSHSFSGKQENTSEASKQINAFLIQESFSKLASQNSLDWLGAVLSLQGIATRDDCLPDDFWRIMKYLAAFIRTNAPRKKEEEGEEKRFFKRIPDYIQEALTVIVQRDLNQNEGVLDLSNTDLRGAKFSTANLHRVNLRGSNLKGVSLSKANLHGANLRGANLQKTRLWEAELQWAKLYFADLQEASLHKANLQRADLRNTKLHGANFERVNLHKACVRGVDLTLVKNLKSGQIASADGDSMTRLPENLSLPRHWMQAMPLTSKELLIKAAIELRNR